jgi:4-alpha-glucanotransferase
MPIYVNFDSADVWSNPELFKLSNKLKPLEIAGVPPIFSQKTDSCGDFQYTTGKIIKIRVLNGGRNAVVTF